MVEGSEQRQAHCLPRTIIPCSLTTTSPLLVSFSYLWQVTYYAILRSFRSSRAARWSRFGASVLCALPSDSSRCYAALAQNVQVALGNNTLKVSDMIFVPEGELKTAVRACLSLCLAFALKDHYATQCQGMCDPPTTALKVGVTYR